MSFTRQRSDRPDPARRRQSPTTESLESRQLLTGVPSYMSHYVPSDLYVTNPITHHRIPFSARDLMQHNNPNSPLLSNQGKIVTGKDRAGNDGLDEAAKDFQKVVDIAKTGEMAIVDPTLEAAFYGLGSIAMQQSRPQDAITWLQQALVIKRSDADAIGGGAGDRERQVVAVPPPLSTTSAAMSAALPSKVMTR